MPAGWPLWIAVVAGLTATCGHGPRARLAALPDAALIERFEELHRPVYQVYAMGTDRDRIHRHLASSFAGEALTREYVEHFTTLARMERERTAIDVMRVDYESVQLLERHSELARIDVDWSVSGLVTHQGHRHPRINRYRAVYTLALDAATPAGDANAMASALRIVDTRVRSAERMRRAQPLGALDSMPSSPAGTLSMEELLRSGLAQEVLDAAGSETAGSSRPGSSPPVPP